MAHSPIKAVFFDLDGTFADTAPDLAYALNRMRAVRGMSAVPLSATRPVTSMGARGLLGVGFGIAPEHAGYRAMRAEFLEIYEANILRDTRLFPGTEELLRGIEARDMAWGIVTNKAEHLARLLFGKLGLAQRACCIVGGDTTPHLKPHPDPLFAACRAAGFEPRDCVYVGDDKRDVDAGRAAGMKTAAARWGYLNGGRPEEWDADWILENPQELLRILQSD
jgi:phosphoglycolate phosphatase